VLGFKVGKNANMTPKIFFSQHFDMCIKNAEFDADFKSVGKSSTKIINNY
jgi:hypothetical protein